MRQFSFLSVSVCLLLPLLVPPTNSYLMMQQAGDVINSACKQCAGISPIFDYDFCVTSLQADPISQHVNLPGLAIVAIELAVENATTTVSTIEKLISSQAFDPFAIACLRDCLEQYADSISKLVMALRAFLSNRFDAANIYLSAVAEETMSCEAEFRQKKGEVTPIVKENYNLFEISIIGLCIINLVSSEPFVSS